VASTLLHLHSLQNIILDLGFLASTSVCYFILFMLHFLSQVFGFPWFALCRLFYGLPVANYKILRGCLYVVLFYVLLSQGFACCLLTFLYAAVLCVEGRLQLACDAVILVLCVKFYLVLLVRYLSLFAFRFILLLNFSQTDHISHP
jgi:hypothetical protein